MFDPGLRARALSTLAAVMILATACGGSDTDTASTGSGDEEAATGPFTVGFTTPGVASLPFLAAIDALREEGYEIETPELAEPELLVDGLARGEFQFSSETTNAALLAAQQGAPVRIVSDLLDNSWTVYGAEGYGTCEDLDGVRVAIHSEGSASAAMIRDWIATECPGTEPNYLVIAGSPNRYAALLAGEIDATPLELADAMALEAEAGDRFTRITSMAESLPQLRPTTVYGNGDWMAENPEVTRTLIQAQLEQNRMVAEDPAYLVELIERYLPEQENVEAVAEAYAPMFPVNGGLSEENLEFTIDFFAGAGAIEPGLAVEEAADLSYLRNVLDEIGTE